MFNGRVLTDDWYPVRLKLAADHETEVPGKVVGDLTVKYWLCDAVAKTAYGPAAADWKEQGTGDYGLRIGLTEWAVEDLYIVEVACALCDTFRFVVNTGYWAGTLGPNTVTLTIEEVGTLNPIAGATVYVRDSTDTYTAAVGATNAGGIAVMLLANGAYKVHIVATGYTFAIGNLTVLGNTAATYLGTPFVVVAPASPLVCRIWEIIYKSDGSLEGLAGGSIKVLDYKAPDWIGGTTYVDLKASHIGTTDAVGYCYVDVVRGATVVIQTNNSAHRKRDYKEAKTGGGPLIVPNVATAQLATIAKPEHD